MAKPKLRVDQMVHILRHHFRSFGGGTASKDNPISVAFKDTEPAFASGVAIKPVVEMVIEMYKQGRRRRSPDKKKHAANR